MTRAQWGGGEWQEHCRRLMSMKYGTEIQFIPDRDRGDGGLEAYCFDGTAFQCYAPQDAYSASTLTDAQKSKINDDIAKLNNDLARTKGLLGNVVLNRWVLLTPSFDSRSLVDYARMKSEKIRRAPRPFWCHDSFEIVISDDKMFGAELVALYGQVGGGLYLDLPDITDDQLFAATGGGVADTLSDKLRGDPGLARDERALGSYKTSLLSDYVRGWSQLELLANDYAALHAVVERRLKSSLGGLARELAGTPGAGPQVVETLLRRLAQALHDDAPGLSPLFCDELARHAIARWFVECPLYFPASA